jgi:biopolymer transport protein ExbB
MPKGATLYSPIEYFSRGGIIMWPILLCSIVALALFLERMRVLRRARQENDRFLVEVRAHLRPGRLEDAVAICQRSPSPLARIFLAGLLRVPDGEDRTRSAIEEAGYKEVALLKKNLGGLASMVGGAPLLGFLGTVQGMIQAFQKVEHMSGRVNPSILASGIWTALLTTAFGLIVAIPAFFAHNFLVSRIEMQVHEMEERSRQFMLVLITGRDALA